MLKTYTVEQSDEWDKIVKGFKDYDVYYLSGYVKGFQLYGEGQAILLYYEDTDTRGINVVMKRDVAEDKYFKHKLQDGKIFDLTIPYGYGGWLIEGEDTDALFSAYKTWCSENHIIGEFVRFHPMLNNAESCEVEYHPIYMRHTVGNNLTKSEDPITADFSKDARKKIRKLLNKGITYRIIENPEDYSDFIEIYESTVMSQVSG